MTERRGRQVIADFSAAAPAAFNSLHSKAPRVKPSLSSRSRETFRGTAKSPHADAREVRLRYLATPGRAARFIRLWLPLMTSILWTSPTEVKGKIVSLDPRDGKDWAPPCILPYTWTSTGFIRSFWRHGDQFAKFSPMTDGCQGNSPSAWRRTQRAKNPDCP